MRVVLENRWAYVTEASRKEDAFLRDYYSYFWPAARYDRRYKLFLWAKHKAELQGIENPKPVGWDGKIRLYQEGRIPAGLFRATRKELKTRVKRLRVRRIKQKLHTIPHGMSAEGKYRFQAECVDAMLRATRYGGGIVLSATGSGKTRMAASYFYSVPKYSCLFVVDTLNLLHQSAKEIGKWLDEPIGVVGEGEYSIERVTVATSQTLHLHMRDKKFRKWYKSIQIVLVDELHEQMGRRNFEVLEKIEPKSCIGLTATLQLSRKPIRAKAWSFAGPVIYEFPIAEATEKEIVSKGGVLQILFPQDQPGTYRGREGYQEEYRNEVAGNREKLRACKKIAKQLLDEDRHVLVLADRISHVDCLAAALPAPNRAIRGAVTRDEREKSRRAFEKSKVRLLIASKVFKKGISINRVDAMIDVAEGGSKNDALQKFGRGVRLHPDKDYLYYIDIGTQGGRFLKRAKVRRKAFREAGIPIRIVKVEDAVDAVRGVRKFLESINV